MNRGRKPEGMEVYFINKTKFDQLRGDLTFKDVAKSVGISPNTMNKIVYELRGLELDYCKKIVDLIGCEFGDLFSKDPITHIRESVDEVVVGERMIVGLRSNILKRIEVSHSYQFVNEVMGLVDDLIIESSYLGVVIERKKASSFIENAVIKKVMEK